MQAVVYDQPARRVIFGVGSIDRLPEEVKRLGASARWCCRRPSSARTPNGWREQLGDVAVGIYADAVMHVPIETARAARAEAARLGADCYVTVGGGSTIGLGKAIALETRPADRGRADDVRGLGDDADLRHHRGRAQEDRRATARCCRGRSSTIPS